MTSSDDFRGVVTPILTPLGADGSVNHDALRALVDFLIERGIRGLMVGGSTGEGMLLNYAERCDTLDTVMDAVAGRCFVIAHVGCAGTRETVSLARHAADAQADAVSAIVPYFYTYDDESLYAHYASLAAVIPDLPVFVYAFPGNAKNDVSPALLSRMRKGIPNLVGIKASTNDLSQVQDYIEAGGQGFVTFCGADTLMLAALAIGSRGPVSGNSNVFPEAFVALYDAFESGDLDRARAWQKTVNIICKTLGYGRQIARFKAALNRRGLDMGGVLAPMRPLTAAESAELDEGLVGIAALLDARGVALPEMVRHGVT